MSDDTENYEELARWNEACRREEAIRGLLERYPKSLNGQAVADLAWELNLSRATLYRMTYLTTSPSLDENLHWVRGVERHAMREAFDLNRDAIFEDIYCCLRKCKSVDPRA